MLSAFFFSRFDDNIQRQARRPDSDEITIRGPDDPHDPEPAEKRRGNVPMRGQKFPRRSRE